MKPALCRAAIVSASVFRFRERMMIARLGCFVTKSSRDHVHREEDSGECRGVVGLLLAGVIERGLDQPQQDQAQGRALGEMPCFFGRIVDVTDGWVTDVAVGAITDCHGQGCVAAGNRGHRRIEVCNQVGGCRVGEQVDYFGHQSGVIGDLSGQDVFSMIVTAR